MASIIRNARIRVENWRPLDEGALRADAARRRAGSTHGFDDCTGVLIPLNLWFAQRDACAALGMNHGVLLHGDDDPALLVPDLERIELIAVAISLFTDGRGYSIARALRSRYGYTGELRAVGDILRDQLPYLMRVGFDAFALRDDQDPQAALLAFNAFSTAYQASADQPLPLFRRRVA